MPWISQMMEVIAPKQAKRGNKNLVCWSCSGPPTHVPTVRSPALFQVHRCGSLAQGQLTRCSWNVSCHTPSALSRQGWSRQCWRGTRGTVACSVLLFDWWRIFCHFPALRCWGLCGTPGCSWLGSALVCLPWASVPCPGPYPPPSNFTVFCWLKNLCPIADVWKMTPRQG